MKKHLIRWAEATPIKDCSMETSMLFLFDNVVKSFGCRRTLMSDQGNHFINSTIEIFLKRLRYTTRRVLIITLRKMG
jgi:hypothetical protein